MARIDRSKRALGAAVKRTAPSRAAAIAVERGLVAGRVLDYGCGHGFDADHFGWESYDPYYRPDLPEGPFDTILCTYVISALSRNNRAKVCSAIRALLADSGKALIAVPRGLPVTGKLGINHSLQNYVVLTLPSAYSDEKLEIYVMRKDSEFKDKTKDYVSRRDRRRDG